MGTREEADDGIHRSADPALHRATHARRRVMDAPGYRSFLVRLWPPVEQANGSWHAEVEHIQSGVVVEARSIEDALAVIRRSTAGPDDPPVVDRTETDRTP
jgi:hypothetical protein